LELRDCHSLVRGGSEPWFDGFVKLTCCNWWNQDRCVGRL
jgi:hypothetical protein